MPAGYRATCPNCGGRLEAVRDQDPDTAPWLCGRCVRGWWPAELTDEARSAWSPHTRDFGPRRLEIMVAAWADRDAARQRGRSDLPEHPEPRQVQPKRAARRAAAKAEKSAKKAGRKKS
jgi:hypothetical protein